MSNSPKSPCILPSKTTRAFCVKLVICSLFNEEGNVKYLKTQRIYEYTRPNNGRAREYELSEKEQEKLQQHEAIKHH